MNLAEQTARRLLLAGVGPDDPGLQQIRRWTASIYAGRFGTCDQLEEAGWLERFPGRCYFYPGRDCPGWRPGQACGRIGDVIPNGP